MTYGEGNPQSIQNFSKVNKWIDKNTDHAWVLGSHLKALNAIYGPRTETYKSSEYHFSVWTVQHRELTIHILAAKDYGCAIEVELPENTWARSPINKHIGAQLVEFLEEHFKKLAEHI